MKFFKCHSQKLKTEKVVNVPDKFNDIGPDVFDGFSAEFIIFGPKTKIIRDYAFSGLGNCKVFLPGSIEEIETLAFENMGPVTFICAENSYADKICKLHGLCVEYDAGNMHLMAEQQKKNELLTKYSSYFNVSPKDYPEIKKMADDGNEKANYILAVYHYGCGAYRKAFAHCLTSGVCDEPDILLMLGIMYEKGLGTPCNPEMAFECYTKSHSLSYPAASYYLALCYLGGIGTTADYAVAFDLFAKSDHKLSGLHLAYMYSKGLGVDANEEKAVKLRAPFEGAEDEETLKYWSLYFPAEEVEECDEIDEEIQPNEELTDSAPQEYDEITVYSYDERDSDDEILTIYTYDDVLWETTKKISKRRIPETSWKHIEDGALYLYSHYEAGGSRLDFVTKEEYEALKAAVEETRAEAEVEEETEDTGFHCPHCSSPIFAEDVFCTYCGKRIQSIQYCTQCGSKCDVTNKFCTKCGTRLRQ